MSVGDLAQRLLTMLSRLRKAVPTVMTTLRRFIASRVTASRAPRKHSAARYADNDITVIAEIDGKEFKPYAIRAGHMVIATEYDAEERLMRLLLAVANKVPPEVQRFQAKTIRRNGQA